MRREILSTYKRKVLSSLDILMIHFYYCPSDPGFFQAIGRIWHLWGAEIEKYIYIKYKYMKGLDDG